MQFGFDFKLIQQQGKRASQLSCPSCGTCAQPKMAIIKDGIEIDSCAPCEGIWFDQHELSKLVTNASISKVHTARNTALNISISSILSSWFSWARLIYRYLLFCACLSDGKLMSYISVDLPTSNSSNHRFGDLFYEPFIVGLIWVGSGVICRYLDFLACHGGVSQ